jgi:histidinol-phosphate aminotransferase
MTSPLSSIVRTDLADLEAYVPHPGSFAVRLDANEAPPLLDPSARKELEAAMLSESFCRYPDAQALALREAIAAKSGAHVDEVLVGCGSDEIVALLLTALDRPRDRAPAATIVTTTPTFVMYRTSARVRGLKVVEVPLDATWDLPVATIEKAIEMARPNLLFIATPNNPTGNLVSYERLVRVIEAAPEALVVVDEAYVDFAGPTQQTALRTRYPNVATLGTISKIGFAALRVGWLIGPRDIVREVDKARQPYNVSVPAQRGATFVLRQLESEIARCCSAIVAERKRVATRLTELGFDVPTSHANFLWVGTRRPAGEMFEALAERGVLVRSFHARGGRLANRLRITIGLRDENDRLLYEMAACA